MRNEFNTSLRKIAEPKLEKLGYKFDGSRKFIKELEAGERLIIQYQFGISFMKGKFTVNLINNDVFERLGSVKSTPFTKLMDKVFGEYEPWWKGVFLPKEKWWKISDFQKEMDSTISQTIAHLEKYGIKWLEKTI